MAGSGRHRTGVRANCALEPDVHDRTVKWQISTFASVLPVVAATQNGASFQRGQARSGKPSATPGGLVRHVPPGRSPRPEALASQYVCRPGESYTPGLATRRRHPPGRRERDAAFMAIDDHQGVVVDEGVGDADMAPCGERNMRAAGRSADEPATTWAIRAVAHGPWVDLHYRWRRRRTPAM